jgi:hypothetical protein
LTGRVVYSQQRLEGAAMSVGRVIRQPLLPAGEFAASGQGVGVICAQRSQFACGRSRSRSSRLLAGEGKASAAMAPAGHRDQER